MLVGAAQMENIIFFSFFFNLLMWCFQHAAGTSVIAGFAIFSILGHMAYIYQMPVDEVVKEGQTRHVDHLLIV